MKVGSLHQKANVYLVTFVFCCAFTLIGILHVMQTAVESELFSLPVVEYPQ